MRQSETFSRTEIEELVNCLCGYISNTADINQALVIEQMYTIFEIDRTEQSLDNFPELAAFLDACEETQQIDQPITTPPWVGLLESHSEMMFFNFLIAIVNSPSYFQERILKIQVNNKLMSGAKTSLLTLFFMMFNRYINLPDKWTIDVLASTITSFYTYHFNYQKDETTRKLIKHLALQQQLYSSFHDFITATAQIEMYTINYLKSCLQIFIEYLLTNSLECTSDSIDEPFIYSWIPDNDGNTFWHVALGETQNHHPTISKTTEHIIELSKAEKRHDFIANFLKTLYEVDKIDAYFDPLYDVIEHELHKILIHNLEFSSGRESFGAKIKMVGDTIYPRLSNDDVWICEYIKRVILRKNETEDHPEVRIFNNALYSLPLSFLDSIFDQAVVNSYKKFNTESDPDVFANYVERHRPDFERDPEMRAIMNYAETVDMGLTGLDPNARITPELNFQESDPFIIIEEVVNRLIPLIPDELQENLVATMLIEEFYEACYPSNFNKTSLDHYPQISEFFTRCDIENKEEMLPWYQLAFNSYSQGDYLFQAFVLMLQTASQFLREGLLSSLLTEPTCTGQCALAYFQTQEIDELDQLTSEFATHIVRLKIHTLSEIDQIEQQEILDSIDNDDVDINQLIKEYYYPKEITPINFHFSNIANTLIRLMKIDNSATPGLILDFVDLFAHSLNHHRSLKSMVNYKQKEPSLNINLMTHSPAAIHHIFTEFDRKIDAIQLSSEENTSHQETRLLLSAINVFMRIEQFYSTLWGYIQSFNHDEGDDNLFFSLLLDRFKQPGIAKMLVEAMRLKILTHNPDFNVNPQQDTLLFNFFRFMIQNAIKKELRPESLKNLINFYRNLGNLPILTVSLTGSHKHNENLKSIFQFIQYSLADLDMYTDICAPSYTGRNIWQLLLRNLDNLKLVLDDLTNIITHLFNMSPRRFDLIANILKPISHHIIFISTEDRPRFLQPLRNIIKKVIFDSLNQQTRPDENQADEEVVLAHLPPDDEQIKPYIIELLKNACSRDELLKMTTKMASISTNLKTLILSDDNVMQKYEHFQLIPHDIIQSNSTISTGSIIKNSTFIEAIKTQNLLFLRQQLSGPLDKIRIKYRIQKSPLIQALIHGLEEEEFLPANAIWFLTNIIAKGHSLLRLTHLTDIKIQKHPKNTAQHNIAFIRFIEKLQLTHPNDCKTLLTQPSKKDPMSYIEKMRSIEHQRFIEVKNTLASLNIVPPNEIFPQDDDTGPFSASSATRYFSDSDDDAAGSSSIKIYSAMTEIEGDFDYFDADELEDAKPLAKLRSLPNSAAPGSNQVDANSLTSAIEGFANELIEINHERRQQSIELYTTHNDLQQRTNVINTYCYPPAESLDLSISFVKPALLIFNILTQAPISDTDSKEIFKNIGTIFTLSRHHHENFKTLLCGSKHESQTLATCLNSYAPQFIDAIFSIFDTRPENIQSTSDLPNSSFSPQTLFAVIDLLNMLIQFRSIVLEAQQDNIFMHDALICEGLIARMAQPLFSLHLSVSLHILRATTLFEKLLMQTVLSIADNQIDFHLAEDYIQNCLQERLSIIDFINQFLEKNANNHGNITKIFDFTKRCLHENRQIFQTFAMAAIAFNYSKRIKSNFLNTINGNNKILINKLLSLKLEGIEIIVKLLRHLNGPRSGPNKNITRLLLEILPVNPLEDDGNSPKFLSAKRLYVHTWINHYFTALIINAHDRETAIVISNTIINYGLRIVHDHEGYRIKNELPYVFTMEVIDTYRRFGIDPLKDINPILSNQLQNYHTIKTFSEYRDRRCFPKNAIKFDRFLSAFRTGNFLFHLPILSMPLHEIRICFRSEELPILWTITRSYLSKKITPKSTIWALRYFAKYFGLPSITNLADNLIKKHPKDTAKFNMQFLELFHESIYPENPKIGYSLLFEPQAEGQTSYADTINTLTHRAFDKVKTKLSEIEMEHMPSLEENHESSSSMPTTIDSVTSSEDGKPNISDIWQPPLPQTSIELQPILQTTTTASAVTVESEFCIKK